MRLSSVAGCQERIFAGTGEDVPETAKILAQALNVAGIEAKLTRESSMQAGQPIGLWIGRKP